MNARGYYLGLQAAIHAAPHVLSSDVRFVEIDANECYVRGTLTLIGDFELHVAKSVVTAPDLERPKYRYHLQTSSGRLSVDGTMHRITPRLPPFPITVTMIEAQPTHHLR